MSNLDFERLRADLEAGTRVPDFEVVHRRAGRIRARDRLAVVLAVLAAVAVAAPVAVTVWRVWPGGRSAEVVGPDRPTDPTEPPTPAVTTAPVPVASNPKARPRADVLAIGGVDLGHLYAAVDACIGDVCSLQISLVALAPDDRRAPVVIGQLRDRGTTKLTDVRLVPLSPTSLLLSGAPVGGQRAYARVSVPRTATDFAGGASPPVPPQGAARPLVRGDRAVQLQDYGQVYGVRSADDELTRLAAQPPLVAPTVAAGVPPADGWWVTGTDPDSNGLAVAVSHDQGRSWTAHPLAPPNASAGVPAVATLDGRTGYVFTATNDAGSDGVAGWRTTDGGASWQQLAVQLPPRQDSDSPARTKLSTAVRPDGSVLLWSGDGNTPAYLESTDRGQTFHRTSGPPGRLVVVSDGYAVVALPPSVSRDGRAWTAAGSPEYLSPA